jgi:hypothetical protein
VKSPSLSEWSFSSAVMALATSLLPADRAEWAAAMQAELRSMDNRRSAWFWALGCLRAGLSERFGANALLDFRAIRWTVSSWLAYRAWDLLYNVGFVLAYKDPQLGLQRLVASDLSAVFTGNRFDPAAYVICGTRISTCRHTQCSLLGP